MHARLRTPDRERAASPATWAAAPTTNTVRGVSISAQYMVARATTPALVDARSARPDRFETRLFVIEPSALGAPCVAMPRLATTIERQLRVWQLRVALGVLARILEQAV